jgi:KUP system potassium uptake protein
MLLWNRGRRLLAAYFADHQVPIETLVEELPKLARVPGVGVFFAARAAGAPLPLVRVMRRFGVLYETNVLLTVSMDTVSHVRDSERFEVEPIAPGLVRIILHFGFMETPAVVPQLDRALEAAGACVGGAERVYLLGRETITPTDGGRMGRFEEGIFAFLSRNAKSPTDWFGLPANQVVEIGAQVDL